jgi:hypothetical protein
MTSSKDNYCPGCKLRLHNRTDKPNFCDAGYTQTPTNLDATVSVLINGGKVCSKNPWKGKAIDLIIAEQKESGMLDVSDLITYCR